MIREYITAIRANARQWSASTKGRSEITCTKKKPHKQKGTGSARQGFLGAPQYKGGGVVFGPKPKFDQHIRINKKERRQVIRTLLADKILNGNLLVIDQSESLETPKTKLIANFLKVTNCNKRVLFLGEGNQKTVASSQEGENVSVDLYSTKGKNLFKSIRNLQKVEFLLGKNVSGYDLIAAQTVVATEQALVEMLQWLEG